MSNQVNNVTEALKKLTTFVEENQSNRPTLCRRAVIYRSDEKWRLLVCTVEACVADFGIPPVETSKIYPQVILFEDWLSKEDFMDFVKQVSDGCCILGGYSLEQTSENIPWSSEYVSLSNIYMRKAGQVWTARFDQGFANTPREFLLASGQPYYPDLFEATKHWMRFPQYLDSSDSRKGEVILLFPETRAYFTDATEKEGMLEIRASGTELNKLPIAITGAWWDEDGIHHFEQKFTSDFVELQIPEHAHRLEYALIDDKGTLYDYQYEDGFRHAGLGRKRSGNVDTTLAKIVRDACISGEGSQVEFKPFVFPVDEKKNDKLHEIYKTVVAFSNAEGGRVFLGINNDCGLDGVDAKLGEWAESKSDEFTCERYLGALRGKICDVVCGDPVINFHHTIVDDYRIIIIEVATAKEKPITIRQDMNLYIRRGSSNSKVSPTEWKAIVCTQNNSSVFR